MALSAVVLPAPLGPMSPRMRPSSTCKSMPSSAIVVPNCLRRPRASMHAMVSALLLSGIRLGAFRACGIEQFLSLQAKPLNRRVNPGPFFVQEFLPFAPQQQACARRH